MWSYVIHVIVDITIYIWMLKLPGFNDVRRCLISYLQTGLYTDDKNAMLEAYQPPQNGPFPVYFVINKYNVTSFDDLRTIISDDRVRSIPIPTKPRTTSDGETVNNSITLKKLC